MNTTNNPKKPVGFLDLPREIRNMIITFCQYRELLVRPHEFEFEHGMETAGRPILLKRSNNPPLAISLLRTARLVHAEAASTLYGKNLFELPVDDATYRAFFESIGPNNASLIARAYIRAPPYSGVCIDPKAPLFTTFERCPHLRELTYHSFGYGDASPLATSWTGRQNFKLLFMYLKQMPSLEKITIQMTPAIHWVCIEKKKTGNPGEAVPTHLVCKVEQAGWVINEFWYKPWLKGEWPQSRKVIGM
ncbi:hypothetical protein PG987_003843 [Apiospora arundinis]